jgi:biofilm PGA synthesis N-glycosyltransferase PgaC
MKHYIAITPVRDEEKLLPGLIASMEAQRIKPERWIIIDDGSTDATARIVDEAAKRNQWIEAHHLSPGRKRALGGESVIMKFLPRTVYEQYDFILRLDADITFPPQFLELLLAEFEKDSSLGIAGAVLHEPDGDGWREIKVPGFHTRGAVKMYSRKCFAAIGGLYAGMGWDTIDEVQAMMLGFKTRSFRHIVAYHHRPQGSAGGLVRGRFATGQAAYSLGYLPVFMLARAVRRMFYPPLLIGSLMLTAGYVSGYLKRTPRAASPELMRFIRRQQLRRLLMMESVWR